MTYWHKVKMSCRQTQPVVLRRGVRFRHGSLFLHQASVCVNSSSARALCGIGIAAYVSTFLVGIFHLPLSRLYLASLEKASPTQTWPAGRLRSRELEDTILYKRGWVTWMEMIPDRRCSIWFPNKAEPGTSIRGAIEFLGGHKSRCVCVCVCVCVCLCVRCFIAFAFETDHVQQGEERMESGGHSNSFVVCNKVHRSSRNKFAECRINCIFLRSNLPI